MADELQCRNSPDLMPPAGHYSHVALTPDLAFLSGQLPITPDGTVLAGEPFEVQVRQVLSNIGASLRAAELSPADLVSVTVYVTNMADWGQFDELYSAWVGDHRPSRCVAAVADLHFGAALEIQAIAARRK